MAIIKWEYGKWNSMMGYVCDQCGHIFPFAEGGLRHEEEIDNNGGVCPNVEEEEAERKAQKEADGLEGANIQG